MHCTPGVQAQAGQRQELVPICLLKGGQSCCPVGKPQVKPIASWGCKSPDIDSRQSLCTVQMCTCCCLIREDDDLPHGLLQGSCQIWHLLPHQAPRWRPLLLLALIDKLLSWGCQKKCSKCPGNPGAIHIWHIPAACSAASLPPRPQLSCPAHTPAMPGISACHCTLLC